MSAVNSQTVGPGELSISIGEPAAQYLELVHQLVGDDFKHIEDAIKEWWCRRLDSSSLTVTIANALTRISSLQHLYGLNCVLALKEDSPRIRASIGQYEDDYFVLSSSDESKIYRVTSPEVVLAYTTDQLVQLEDTLSTDNVPDSDSIKWAMQLLQNELDTTRILATKRRYMKLLRRLVQRFHFLPPSFFLRNLTHHGNQIMGGGFSDIWKGQFRNEAVCLKVLRIFGDQDPTVTLKKFCEEALVWKQLRHPNILPFLGVSMEVFSPRLCLVSPWMPNGNIVEFLKATPEHDRLTVITEIAEGLAYLHGMSPPIVHGDIKGVNILVTNDHRCCLADFGLAVTIETKTDSSSTRREGTMRWLAPEVIQPGNNRQVILKPARDIYAFACTVFEVFTGLVPFVDYTQDMAVMLAVLEGKRPTRPSAGIISDTIWALMDTCWAQDPGNRPTAAGIAKSLRYVSFIRRIRQDRTVTSPREQGQRVVVDPEHQAKLREYHERLVLEPRQSAQLDLLNEERILIHSGNLIVAGEERHVLLLDNFMVITTPEEHDGFPKYRIFGQPILVRLISHLEDFNQKPDPLHPSKPTKSFYHFAIYGEHIKRRYPRGPDEFINSPIVFYFESARTRAQWQTAFVDAKTIDGITEKNSRMFKPEALDSDAFRTKPTCSVLFHATDGGELVAVGCDDGIWIGSRHDPNTKRHALHLDRVEQCAMLEELGIFLVLADSSLLAYRVDALDQSPNENRKIPQKLNGKQDVVFFSVGQLSGRTFIIYVVYDSSYVFRVLEPVPDKINEGPGTRAPASIRSLLFWRSPKSGSEWFNVYKKFTLTEAYPTLWKPFDVLFLKTKIAILCAKSVEIMDLNDVNCRKIVPNESNPSHAQLLRRCMLQDIVGMFQVTDDEYLIVYNDFGVYINRDGDICRPNSIVEWELRPVSVVLHHPYILLSDRFLLEVRDLKTGDLVQVMKLPAECLWNGCGRNQQDSLSGRGNVHVLQVLNAEKTMPHRISELVMVESPMNLQ